MQIQSLGREDPLEEGMAKSTPEFWNSREFHRQRSLAGNSPQVRKESDTTEETQHACVPTPTNRAGGYFKGFQPRIKLFLYLFFFFLIFVGLIFGHAMQHEGSFIPNQGSNPCSQHWTTRDFYFFFFFWIPLLLGNKPFSVFDGSTA